MSVATSAILMVVGITWSVISFMTLCFLWAEGVAMRWRVLTSLVLAGSVTAAVGGIVEGNRAATASQHRECFTVTGLDNGQGFAHSREVYATPHSYKPNSDDVLGALVVGHHYCGIVEDSTTELRTLLTVEASS